MLVGRGETRPHQRGSAIIVSHKTDLTCRFLLSSGVPFRCYSCQGLRSATGSSVKALSWEERTSHATAKIISPNSLTFFQENEARTAHRTLRVTKRNAPHLKQLAQKRYTLG